MDEYYKDGQFLPDRRSSSNMEIQQAVLKLIAKVESMEINIDTKLEAVKDKIGNMDEKLTNRVDEIEKKLNNHCDEGEDMEDVLIEHDKKFETAKNYIEKINKIEGRCNGLEIRVGDLEKMPINSKASIVDTFIDILKKVVFTAIATGIVGFLGYLLISYLKKGG